MKYVFSGSSLIKMVGVHPGLVQVVRDVMGLQAMDFSVMEGVRTIERQKKLLDDGKTKTLNSKHLIQPDGFGWAVDLYPYPIDMKRVERDAREISRFGVLAGLMLAMARKNNVELTWGGDWDRDGETLDHTFFDAPHFELKG
jgi:peptidoglycan L-alanyl-D-glutamate endopeptidase CwlK